MAIARDMEFHYDVAEAQETGGPRTTIHCHGRLVNSTVGQVKELVKPLLARSGRIVLDCADLQFLDSSGLGALVGLKISALHQGQVRLELANPPSWMKDLLSNTNLMQLFGS
ncbi:MAG: STAS domain-containing protein [Acidobacteriota bacterium]